MPGLTPPGIHVHPCLTLEAGTPVPERRVPKQHCAVPWNSIEHQSAQPAAASKLPSAAEYCRFGISVEGLELVLGRHAAAITDDTTTSDVCHSLIKPKTVPTGWSDDATLIDAQKRWYKHTYRELKSGRV
eukprot:COSAG02_NODE_22301_length_757_cov_0.796353_1_plen_129_part_10